VASWSSIEFTGRWRALHHAARRFFAPAVVSAHVPGEEVFGLNNYRHSTVRKVHLHTTYDAPQPAAGLLRWDLFHLDGTVVEGGRRRVALRPMQSARQVTLDLAAPLAKFGRENLYLRIALDIAGRAVSTDTILFTLPRFIELPRARPRAAWAARGPRRASVTLTSPVFQHRFELDFPGHAFSASDNFFDLYPGEPKRVELEFPAGVSLAALRRAFRARSLADTY
jgi:beta-mannosidase